MNKLFLKIQYIGNEETLIRLERGGLKKEIKKNDIVEVELPLAQEYARNSKKFVILEEFPKELPKNNKKQTNIDKNI